MLAGLPQYQQGKEAYSLHLGMVQEAMKIFQDRRLADIASVEQVCPRFWQHSGEKLTSLVVGYRIG